MTALSARDFPLRRLEEKEYSFGKICFVEQFPEGHVINQWLSSACLVIDFAPDKELELDGTILSAASWKIKKYSGSRKRLIIAKPGIAHYFSIILSKNLYPEWDLGGVLQSGTLTIQMFFTLLKIMNRVTKPQDHDELWIELYIRLLTEQMRNPLKEKRCLLFAELKIINEVGEGLKALTNNFPIPGELSKFSGMNVSKFQKNFREFHGLSPQKMIQHYKMKRAWDDILEGQKSISNTFLELGYQHSANFITAFRKYFDITPMELTRSLLS